MARGGGPPNFRRITGTPSHSEVPSVGARALLVTFGWAGIPGSFPKVTRCKSGTITRRYRSNGSVPIRSTHTPSAFSPSGLPLKPVCRYTRRLSKVRQRVLPAMEINPILNTIKDLSERSETIRGYL
ncbi:hypothetical protein ACW9IB_16895, partial [Pseudomonas sp. SDO524_S393]